MEPISILPPPGPGDRVCFMGNTGEGKSVLAATLLLSVPNAIIINTKNDPFFEQELLLDDPEKNTIRSDEEIFGIHEGRFNYVPSDEFQEPDKRGMLLRDRFFKWLLEAGSRVCYVDEFNDICPSAQIYPYQFHKSVKQGRWRKVGIWGSSQEPIGTPRFCFGQAQHRYLFFTGWPDHRKLAEQWFQERIPWDLIPERSNSFILKTPGGTFGPQPPIDTPLKLE